jgi:putative ABC transport system permease protein
MSALMRASVGYLLRHPLQLVLAIAGITIGVGAMVAIDLANQSSRKAFLMSMDTLNGEATHQVIAGPGGVDESVYTRLRTSSGIRSIAPVVSGYIFAGDRSLRILGIDVFAERDFRHFTSPASIRSDLAGDGPESSPEYLIRQLLTTEGGVMMSRRTAESLRVDTGGTIRIIANGRTFEATLIATTDDGQGGAADIVVADISTAQAWLGMPGKLSRIDVKLGPEAGVSESAMRELLPDGAELLSASGRTRATADMSSAFMTNLNAMSLLALLVGIFLIYNSVAFAVLQRRDLIGVLRALGVTRGQVFRLILGEAAAIGIAGSVLGVLVGTWLGDSLLVLVTRTLSDHYFAVSATDVDVPPHSLVKGLLAGIAVTLLAATVPAREAANNPPRLSLTRSALEQRAGRLPSKMGFAGFLTMAAAAGLLAGSGRSLFWGLTGLFVLILGFALCVPLIARTLSESFSPLAGRMGGAAARLAFSGVGQSLSRTGVAIVALAVAVSATIGVSVMVGSFRESVSDWLDNTLQSDVYVGVVRGSMDPALIGEIETLPGVRAVSTSRRAWLESEAGRVRVIAIDMAPGSHARTRLRHPEPSAAWRQFDEEGAILVSDSYAYRNDLARGQIVELNTRAGRQPMEVAAVYQSYDSNEGAIMMSRATYDRLFDDPGIDSIGIYLDAGVDPESAMAAIRELGDERQALIMNSNDTIRDISLGIFDRTFVITNVLYWISIGVAVIGILGAMLAIQLERSREFGILRAIGMTPLQTGGLVIMQTGFLGFIAGVASIPLGLVMAWVLIEVINRRAFGWQIDFTVTAGPILSALFISICAAVFAGLYPSLRAAGTRPALAMREE